MRHTLSLLALALAAMAACKSQPAPPAPETSASTTAASAAASTSATPSASARPSGRRPPHADAGAWFTREKRAAFLKDLTLGRKLSRAKDFTAALAAFDRALAVAPDDVRSLSEVGWAALNAGDLTRAEAANKRALALAKHPTARAQILYNAGRVAQARNDLAGARRAYAESLSLRNNAEVEKRLKEVGGAPEGDIPCSAAARDVEALCKFLLADGSAPMTLFDGKSTCAAVTPAPALGTPRLLVVRYGAEELGERAYLLAARDGAVVRPLVELGRDYEPGAFGIHNGATIVGGEARKVGARAIVVVKSEQRNLDLNMAGLEACTESVDMETICKVGEGSSATRCVAVPVAIEAGCGPGAEPDPDELDEETRAALAELKKGWQKTQARLGWSISPEGEVVVTRTSGDDSLVPVGVIGKHPLF
jgi:tetratricopeptide (TPR) repeat protein